MMKRNIVLKNITRICLTGIFLFVLTDSFSQNKESLPVARNYIINEQIAQAVACYAQLVSKDEVNSVLLTEYAYALALSGIYEGALMNLDRARLFGNLSSEGYFYIVQIFSLMGYDWVTMEYVKKISIPDWIANHYEKLYYKYKQIAVLHYEDLDVTFKRTNYLASTGMNFQSIALYEQLLEEYPDEYIFHVGYSIPLEKVGLPKLAAEELETGISLMPDESQFDEAKQAFNQRLEQLKQLPENATPKSQAKPNKFNPKTMLYAGGMFSETYTSFNSRFGVYLSNSFNGAINLGVLGNSTTTAFNIGLSGYQRFFNVLVLGFGLNDQKNKDSNVLSVVPSLGFSFINGKRNSSWDIFFNLYCPLQEGAINTYGISIGKSFYFGTR